VVLFFLFGLENLAEKTRFYRLVTQRKENERRKNPTSKAQFKPPSPPSGRRGRVYDFVEGMRVMGVLVGG